MASFQLPPERTDCPLCGYKTLTIPRHRRGVPCSQQEDEFIQRCREHGVEAAKIAEMIGTSPETVWRRIRALSGAKLNV